MEIKKITVGFVTQSFTPEGKFLEQNFTAGDVVDWEDDYGNCVDPENWFQPFNMEDPEREESYNKLTEYIVNDEVEIDSYLDHKNEDLDPRNHVYYHAMIAAGLGDDALADVEAWEKTQQKIKNK